MKQKPIETPDEMLEHLREYVIQCIKEKKELLMERIGEIGEFQQGKFSGAHDELCEIFDYIRRLQKHGYEHLTVDDYEETMTKVEHDGRGPG